MTVTKLKELIRDMANSPDKMAIFAWGPPGVGKTAGIMQAGAELGRKVYAYSLTSHVPEDFTGIPTFVQDEAGNKRTHFAAPDFLPSEGNVIFFLDEVTSAPPSMQVIAQQITHERRIGSHHFHPDALILCAGNRREDKAVVHEMPSALRNRFLHIEVMPDVDEFCAWANLNNIDWRVIAFLRHRRDFLYNFDPARNDRAFPTPRTWHFTSNILKNLKEDFWLEVLNGTIGEGTTSQFIGYVKVALEIPTPKEICEKPEKAPIFPKDPDKRYAVICSLVSYVISQAKNHKDFKPIKPSLKYLIRLDEDFLVVALRDILAHRELHGAVVPTSEFRDIFNKCKDAFPEFSGQTE